MQDLILQVELELAHPMAYDHNAAALDTKDLV